MVDVDVNVDGDVQVRVLMDVHVCEDVDEDVEVDVDVTASKTEHLGSYVLIRLLTISFFFFKKKKNSLRICLRHRRTYATFRLLSFSTKLHPVCPCFQNVVPHVQHESSVNSPACENFARPRSKNSQRVHTSPSYRGDLYVAIAAHFLRGASFVKMSFLDAQHWLRTLSGEVLVVESLDSGPNFFGNSWRKFLFHCLTPALTHSQGNLVTIGKAASLTAFSCERQVPDVGLPHYRDARMQHPPVQCPSPPHTGR